MHFPTSSATFGRLDRRVVIGAAISLLVLWLVAILHQTEHLPEVNIEFGQKFNESKLALLIETRASANLIAITLHMISVIPPDWKHRVMGTDESLGLLNSSAAIRHQVKIGKLDLSPIPQNMSINDFRETSVFLTTLWFYEEVLKPAEYLLLWQTDSIMCANADHSLDDYLEYDWVGAPWFHPKFPHYGGNGGLSLRKVSSIVQVLRAQRWVKGLDHPEDHFFAELLYRRPGANMPSEEVGLTFSQELRADYDHLPLGYHLGGRGGNVHLDIWQTPEKRAKMWDYCPELKLAMGTLEAAQYLPGNCNAVFH